MNSVFTDMISSNKSYVMQLLGASGLSTSTRESGSEVCVSGWFTGSDWVHQSFGSAVVERRLLAGGVGPLVPFAGGVFWFWRHARPQIVKQTLLKLTSILRKTHHVGFVGLSLENGLVVDVEIEPMDAQIALINGSTEKLIRGQTTRLSAIYDFAVQLRTWGLDDPTISVGDLNPR